MLNQIRYFQSVVHNNSFTKAAEECHISQSAISQQIKALEQELGIDLFARHNRSFELTLAGEYFYKKSLILIADYERIVGDTVRIAKKDNPELRIGYLRSYFGHEIQSAVASFSEKYPNVSVQIIGGNHEDLYDLLRTQKIDIAMNDQRRAFADGYFNVILQTKQCYIEIAARNPIASLKSVSPEELKNTPCILISSKQQQKNEMDYFGGIVGFGGDFLFAENVEEARLMVVQNNGFMPVDGGPQQIGNTIVRIPLARSNRPMTRNYCAFWKESSTNNIIEDFAEMLKTEFHI